MKIQFLNGGLANQAFQYIFAKQYESSHGEPMYLDDSYFALHSVHNGYELEKVFGIRAPMLSGCFSEDVWQFILKERGDGKSVPQILCENGIEMFMIAEVSGSQKHFNPFDGAIYPIPSNAYLPEIQDVPGNIYYHGYWINMHWFECCREHFLEEFRFPEITDEKNREYQEQIRMSPSVAIHIRRGDYVPLGLAIPLDQYPRLTEAFVKLYSPDWEAFVFSDDIPRCREQGEELGLGSFSGIHFVEGEGQW